VGGKSPAQRKRDNERRYAITRGFLRWVKDQPCYDCGGSFPPWVMDLDHVRGTKKVHNVGNIICTASYARIVEEVLKCDVVCANCHRERTHNAEFTESAELDALCGVA